MSTIWNLLKLSSAFFGTSLFVVNSSFAAQKLPDQMAENQQSAAATDQPIDLLSSPNKLNKQQKQLIPAIEDTKFKERKITIADSTPANQTTDSSIQRGKLTDVAQNSTGESKPSVEQQIDQINQYSDSDATKASSMSQVTNVSQFSDVRPGDWAYEALRELVERYGCIAGYPDSTYRGNRAMTRYEFAAGLRACLNQIEKLIAASTTNFASKEDLEKLRRLTQEFQGELATLGTRVDKLESRVGFLENHQFSTTTKLNAEIIFAVSTFGAFDGKNTALPSRASTVNRPRLNSNTIFSDRVRLNFDTSFIGKDRLRARLEANNTTSFSGGITGTNETRLAFDRPGNLTDNTFVLGRLEYRFPLTSSTTVFVEATGGELNDLVNTNNPYLEASGLGAISRFGRFNPIYRINNPGPALGTGGAIIQQLGDAFSISAAYLAPRGNDPLQSRGLFNGTYAALGQINFQPTKALNLGLTYVHAYEAGSILNTNNPTGVTDIGVTGSTGSTNANQPFGTAIPTSIDAYGTEASFRVNPFLTISGWGGLEFSTAERSNAARTVRRGNHATSYNYGVTFAFPDLGKKGNLAALIFGQPPKATRNDSGLGSGTAPNTATRRRDRDSSYHLEGLYRYQLTKNVSITPGFFVILNPENNTRNSTEYVGTVRTVFTF